MMERNSPRINAKLSDRALNEIKAGMQFAERLTASYKNLYIAIEYDFRTVYIYGKFLGKNEVSYYSQNVAIVEMVNTELYLLTNAINTVVDTLLDRRTPNELG